MGACGIASLNKPSARVQIPLALFDTTSNGGERGIRTLGTFRFNGFQDHRIRPLCHLSGEFHTQLQFPRL